MTLIRVSATRLVMNCFWHYSLHSAVVFSLSPLHQIAEPCWECYMEWLLRLKRCAGDILFGPSSTPTFLQSVDLSGVRLAGQF